MRTFLSHMSLDGLDDSRDTLKILYQVGDYEVSMPLMADDYTRKEINDKLVALKTDYVNKINAEVARANKDNTDLQNQINRLNNLS